MKRRGTAEPCAICGFGFVPASRFQLVCFACLIPRRCRCERPLIVHEPDLEPRCVLCGRWVADQMRAAA